MTCNVTWLCALVCHVQRTVDTADQKSCAFIYWGFFIYLFIYLFIFLFEYLVLQLLGLDMLSLVRFTVAVACCIVSADAGKITSFMYIGLFKMFLRWMLGFFRAQIHS